MPPINRPSNSPLHPSGPNQDAGIDHPQPSAPNRDAGLTRQNRDDGLTCEICGFRMLSRQCKIRCPNCGYTRDCSDP